jgi:hypothetical protein
MVLLCTHPEHGRDLPGGAEKMSDFDRTRLGIIGLLLGDTLLLLSFNNIVALLKCCLMTSLMKWDGE